ncbi:MAG: class I SAM-dependent methyltransferase [Mariprofundaceae bacterium]
MICDLCDGQTFSNVSDRDRHGDPLSTVICCGCGLVSHATIPSEEEVAEYYRSRYRQEYHGENTPSTRRIMRAWNNGERILMRLYNYIGKEKRLFEVGAGIGCTVKSFEHYGCDASGIEPNEDFNSFTQEKLKANVENSNLFDVQPAADIDIVLLIHVIEHFTSPSRALKHIHQMLNDGGLLYIECPNLTGPFATFARMFHFAHIYNFTPETLQWIAEKTGFEVEKSFSAAHDPDIHLLLRKSTPKKPAIALDAAAKIGRRIHRLNIVSYHLRPAYLFRRIRKLMAYLKEYAFSKKYVGWLLKKL